MTFIKAVCQKPDRQGGLCFDIKEPSLTVGLPTLLPTKKGTARRALHQIRESLRLFTDACPVSELFSPARRCLCSSSQPELP
jgi:hypothetical protein